MKSISIRTVPLTEAAPQAKSGYRYCTEPNCYKRLPKGVDRPWCVDHSAYAKKVRA